MVSRDLYNRGRVTNFEDGTTILERTRYRRVINHDEEIYVFKDGDSLTALSYKFYGEPLYWYLIADVNDIINPFDIETGTNLIIPNINLYK